ncbi:MAG TPA: 30S ribosomal protein S5 [Candidatus Nanoarchaeia archaeon]|nr:30S ribosomal protein S5 [Candidatus Nanoarchaeia archaeon]
MTKQKKQEFEDTKKTVEAYGTFSEKEALDLSEKNEKIIDILDDGEIDEVVIKEIEEKKEILAPLRAKTESTSGWNPKTKLGREVKDGKITNINQILETKRKILEPEIVDFLLPLKSDLISIGQSKGKFGGGKRRAWRQTQRKTEEGNVPTFSTMAIVGDENGHIGFGTGRAKETLPARDKAMRKAKLNVIKVVRACSSFDCACSELHSIPFKVSGKSGSVRITLIPAPQGTGLVVGKELKKVLKLTGIKDVYSKTFGTQGTSYNLVKAGVDALKKTNMNIGGKNDSSDKD